MQIRKLIFFLPLVTFVPALYAARSADHPVAAGPTIPIGFILFLGFALLTLEIASIMMSGRRKLRDDWKAFRAFLKKTPDAPQKKRTPEPALVAHAVEPLDELSHELRSTLHCIRGYAGLLLHENLSPAQREYVKTIDDSTKSLLHIVTGILKQSKAHSGSLDIASAPFDLASVISQVCRTLHPLAARKKLQLIWDADKKIPSLLGDSERLQQIIMNLAGNAVQFTDSGSVSVHARIVEQNNRHVMIEIAVKDTGIGIPLEQQDLIFHSFMRAENSGNRGGTGLGLPIASMLVHRMNGILSLESTPENGSLFKVRIPFTVALASTQSNAPVHEKTVRILLVDDNSANRILSSKILQNAGYFVVTAENGEEALAKLAASDFDLILMDVQMPVLDGYRTAEKIRTGNVQPDIPILALTAGTFADDIRRGLSSGMNDYLTIPVEPSELVNKVSRWTSPRSVR